MEPIRHLYVHIPFCPHICPYCCFHVLPVHKAHAQKVADLLLQEYGAIAPDLKLETLFLGGGTPTALSTDMLATLLSGLLPQDPHFFSNPGGDASSDFALAAACRMDQFDPRLSKIEVTIECNPSTLSPPKAERLLDRGVNRISIGAQSLDPVVLHTLGRTHSDKAVVQCVETARAAGFSNINIDLMFGAPGQTLESWTATLEAALNLHPQHLSCYGLTYEEDTEFFVRRQRGTLHTDPDLEKSMFEAAERILESAGYRHYEISNYALPGYESRHNLGYWRGEDYYGIGPSAVSTVRGIRSRNGKFDGMGWRNAGKEPLASATLASERMALGLRMREGVDEAEFIARFGFAPHERWGREIQFLVENGLLRLRPALHLTSRGKEVADEIAAYFV